MWWGSAALGSEVSKQVRFVDRNVSFISDAGSWQEGGGEGGRHLSKSRLPLSPPPMTQQAWDERFHRQSVWGGGHDMQKQHSRLY